MKINVLVSSAGRRVGLLNCIRESFAQLGATGRVTAIDATFYSSAAQFADAFYRVPRCLDPEFLPQVEEICERENIHLLIPTIDTELPVYAGAQSRLGRLGVTVNISSAETVRICQDKVLTNEWLSTHGFPAPRQSFPSVILANVSDWNPPLILKPRFGSASIGVQRIHSLTELAALSANAHDLIAEELIQGQEYTINVFVNRSGKCVCAVPHRRVEVRAGEVAKGITARNPELIELIQNVVEQLPGAFGAMNVQCFLTPAGEFKIIEMNARFGGGYPLAHRAGAPMTQWLIEEALGRKACGPFDRWEDGLMMLRYDEAVFVPASTLERSSRNSYLEACREAIVAGRHS